MNIYQEDLLIELEEKEERKQKLIEEIVDMDEYPLGYNPYQE